MRKITKSLQHTPTLTQMNAKLFYMGHTNTYSNKHASLSPRRGGEAIKTNLCLPSTSDKESNNDIDLASNDVIRDLAAASRLPSISTRNVYLCAWTRPWKFSCVREVSIYNCACLSWAWILCKCAYRIRIRSNRRAMFVLWHWFPISWKQQAMYSYVYNNITFPCYE